MIEISLKVLEHKHMQQIIYERNKVLNVLRTPYFLNEEMQNEYFQAVICNRDSNTRYFAIYNEEDEYIGYGGIENWIDENRIAELSLLIFEDYRNMGYGKKAVEYILDNAFNYFNLKNVYLECYECNVKGLAFWNKILDNYNGYKTKLPNRKYYSGKYWYSLYGNITKDDFNGRNSK